MEESGGETGQSCRLPGSLLCAEILTRHDPRPGVYAGVLVWTHCLKGLCSGHPKAVGTCLEDPHTQSHSLEGTAWLTAGSGRKAPLSAGA